MPAAIDEQIIFNAALKVMTERGYTGATTKLIAEEAGVGEVTLFRRFGNKETLILEAMKREASKLEGTVKLYSGKLEADLTKIMTAYQLLLRARAALLLTFYTEVTRHPELAIALEQPKHTIAKMLEMLGRYQQEGKLMTKDPMHQLSELFGPVMMLTLFETVYQGDAPLDVRAHVRNFMKSNRP
jgi:AcrR family transcriptional regulator